MSNYNNFLIITIFCIHFLLKIYLSNYQPSADVRKQYLGSSWQLPVQSVQCSVVKDSISWTYTLISLLLHEYILLSSCFGKEMYNKHFYTCFKYVGFVGVSLAIWQRGMTYSCQGEVFEISTFVPNTISGPLVFHSLRGDN